MEHRKIQVTGNKTFIVSLPKKWAQSNNVRKGDFIGVVDKGGNLLLRLEDAGDKGTEIKIGKKTDIEFIKRLLITRYIQGYNVIVVVSKNSITPDVRAGLKETTKFLIGLEPFGESSNEMTFRMLMKEQEDIIDSISRMHEMSVTSLREITLELGKGKEYNEDVLNGVILRESEIDKFYFLIMRYLSSYPEHNVCPWLRIVERVEIISDHIEEIARFMQEGDEIYKDFVVILNEAVELYCDTMLSLRSENTKMANEIIEKAQNLKRREMSLVGRIKESDQVMIYNNFHHIIRYISSLGKSIINLF